MKWSAEYNAPDVCRFLEDPKLKVHYIIHDGSRYVIFYDAAIEKLESTPVVEGEMEFAKWLEENVEVIKDKKITLYRYHGADGWGNYTLDDIYTEYKDKI